MCFCVQGGRARGAQVEINGEEERKRLADVMQKHWNGLQQAMQQQPGHVPVVKGKAKTCPQSHLPQVVLGAPRLGWGDRVREEIVMTCERASRCEAPSTGSPATHPPHRVYVQKTGKVVSAATSLVHGVGH